MKKYFAASKIRAVQIHAMQNRASQGMPVTQILHVKIENSRMSGSHTLQKHTVV